MDRHPKSILKEHKPEEFKPAKKIFTWDEANLQQNEDEKVPRMKIDEPKTPYRRGEEDSDEDGSVGGSANESPSVRFSVSSSDTSSLPSCSVPTSSSSLSGSTSFSAASSTESALNSSLATLGGEGLWKETEQRRTAWDLSSEEPGGVMQEKDKQRSVVEKKEFETKRKQHYNMGHLLRQAKLKAQQEDEEEESREADQEKTEMQDTMRDGDSSEEGESES
eukprot:gb/GEZN01011182.1/.p1 GENE.gb/GEZN01011182.1/~~gb/GEZN01011182.1/.p1  ORF type:complete len:229 (+),score=68.40 gb/GEZN01011182.1/:26-688(+)